ncbi:heme-binding beta-barrel domain-containing protein [Actinomycetaceae bacterium MB13-C1-2]|nr:heme-binding beta-barrel domain-containing protein [Actinomycetaceae bacterium MB13-C1-2]
MFEIPENLPLQLAPLAWLVGTWQGWGTLVGEGEVPPLDGEEPRDEPVAPDAPILQHIEADVLGDQLRMKVSFYAGHVAEEVDPLWTAAEGMDHIIAGELLWEETLYWSVPSPLATLAGGEDPRELRVTAADSRGYAVLWSGVGMGPRIRLDSDAIVLAPGVEQVDHMSRMFGLVGGELMWASDNKVGDEDFETKFTGRLQRASRAVSVEDVGEEK